MKVMTIAGSVVLLAGFFQMPSTPPMKMGLWEMTSTTTMTIPGMNTNMPARATKVRMCHTPESWANNLMPQTGRPGAQSNGQSDCVMSNQSFTGHTFSVDISCPKSGTKGHMTTTWDGSDSSHGTTHMEINSGGRSMTMDGTSTSRFVSSDCGAVKPGSAVVVQ